MKKKSYEAPDERVREISFESQLCVSPVGSNESFEGDSYDDPWVN